MRATRRSPWLTLLARCECLKRYGVGESEKVSSGRGFYFRCFAKFGKPQHSGGNFLVTLTTTLTVHGTLLLPHSFVSEGYRGISNFAHDGVSYRAFARVVAIIYTFAYSSRNRQQIAHRPGQDECERSFCVGRTEWQSRF